MNGKDALFTVNGGATLASRSNTLGKEGHGIEGLTVTALATGNTAVNLTTDTAPLKEAITGFIDQYNKLQSVIGVQTASSTDAKGVVTAGLLASDTEVSESSRKLRGLMAADVPGLSSTVKRLESLGYKTDGYSNNLSLENPGALQNALANSLQEVQSFFGDSANGLAAKVANYVEGLVGAKGSLQRHRDGMASQSAHIDEQIGQMEQAVLASQETLFNSFRSMERTLAQINRQAAFFNQRFGLA